MTELESVLQKLRPLVGKNGWEYCVVWKLGDYSTRFIEMIGCCCCGGAEETQHNGEDNSLQLCRDVVIPHPIRTKACNALANLPASIPLSFGIYVEVLVSGQPRWISPDEMNGTRVLIPVLGGLIELFAAIQIPQDYPMMELILAYCNDEKEARISCMDKHLNVVNLEDGNEFLSTDPFPLADHHPFRSDLVCGPPQVIEPDYSLCTQSKSKNVARQKRKLVSHTSNNKEGYLIDLKKQDGNSQKSRNLVIERNRRKKLKTLILTLRSLVPNITKMDIQATLGDASSYIVELLKKVETLEDELKQMETEEANEYTESENQRLASRKPDNHVTSQQSRSEISTDQSEYNPDGLIVGNLEEEIEETVEVIEFDKKEFSLKLIIQKKRGWFQRLMKAMNSLGLSVTEANVLTMEHKVMAILKAEAKLYGFQAQQLKGAVSKLMQNGLLLDQV